MICRSLVFLAGLAGCFSAWALDPVRLDLAHSDDDARPFVDVLYDSSRRRQLPDILAGDAAEGWVPMLRYRNLGKPHEAPLWFRLQLENVGDRPVEKILHIPFAAIDQLDYFLVVGGREVQRYQTGGGRPFESRWQPFPDYAFPVTLAVGGQATVYLRVLTGGPVTVPLDVLDVATFTSTTRGEVLANGMFAGVLLMLIAVYLIAAFGLRNQIYVASAAWMLSILLLTFSIGGLGYQYLWRALPGFNVHANSVFGWCATLALLVYVITAGEIQRARPALFWTTVAIFCSHTVALVWEQVGSGRAASLAVNLHLVALAIVVAFIGREIIRLQRRAGVYLVISLILVFAGGAAWWSGVNSGASYSADYADVMRIALVAGAFFQALSLVEDRRRASQREEKFRREVQRKEAQLLQMKEEALQRERRHSEQLERKVRQRTRELSRALKRLSRSHSLLEARSNVDPLTELYNRHFFNQRYEEEWRRAHRNRYPLSLMIVDVDDMHMINSRFGHVEGDDVLCRVARTIADGVTRGTDVVARYGGDEFAVILAHTDAAGARLVAERLQLRIGDIRLESPAGPLAVSVSICIQSGVPVLLQGWREHLVEANWSSYQQRMGIGNRILVESFPA